jgi:hypothetical protein
MDDWQVRTVYEPAKRLDEHRSGWQFGETGYLAALSERLAIDLAIEIGAGDGGKDLPLTQLPQYRKGILTILYEIDELRQRSLRQVYPLATVFGEYNDLPKLDYFLAGVVIDVDGFDLSIALHVAARARPAFICVEHFDLAFSETTIGQIPKWLWGERLQRGGFIMQATLSEIQSALGAEPHNYQFIAFSRVNSIYVRRDLLPALEG